MIDTEHQRQAAMSWIRYWNQSLSAGQQSWQGQEEALRTRIQLRKEIDEYDQRAGVRLGATPE